MIPLHHKFLKNLVIITFLLPLMTVCRAGFTNSTTTPTFSPSPTEYAGGLSPDEIDTLTSLDQLDEYPFYSMRYVGGYAYPHIGGIWHHELDFTCSLFTALGGEGGMFYGRNFDWEFSPALLLFTDPPDGYASVSIVDLIFLGISPVTSSKLVDLPVEERTALLTAPSMPFDGMNEFGLTIGMAAVPDEFVDDASFDSARPTIGSIGIIRQVLDHARNVDEAVEIFEDYNIDFRGGPPIHYLIADRDGEAVLIEYYQGQMIKLYNHSPWHMATNYLRCIADGDGGCLRYRTLSEKLASVNGQLVLQSAMTLLSEVDQGMTQWSSVYNMTTGEVNVVIARKYGTIYSFHLDLIYP